MISFTPKIGTTFSQVQCRYLNLDYQETFTELLTLKFDIIRISAYWDEIESKEGEYNFDSLDWLVNTATQNKTPLVLSVGMKTPRWPEFHFPQWIKDSFDTKSTNQQLDKQKKLAEKCVQFVETVIKRYKDNANILYIQIENEAFNNFNFTHNRYLGFEHIKKEVELARTIAPDKKIVLTNAINIWPNDFKREYYKAFKQNLSLADAVGTNVYTTVPLNSFVYMLPTWFFWIKLWQWAKLLKKNNKEAWITESQAEPWEYGKAIHTEKQFYPSASPQSSIKLAQRLHKLGYETILLWGCEYWYWHKKQGRTEWWNSMKEYIEYK